MEEELKRIGKKMATAATSLKPEFSSQKDVKHKENKADFLPHTTAVSVLTEELGKISHSLCSVFYFSANIAKNIWIYGSFCENLRTYLSIETK